MRKWMRERLTRRKKGSDAGKSEPAAAPLQPAYFDAEPARPASAAEEIQPEGRPARSEPVEAEAPEPQEREFQSGNAQRVESQSAVQGPVVRKDDPRRKRRRRGRGGRGRSRGGPQSGQPVAAGDLQTHPAAASEPSAPLTPAAPESSGITEAISPQRAPKGVVVLAIGLPGSGKSSWFKRHKISPLSSDLMRALLFDDPTEQRFQDLVFSNLRSMLKARLIARRPMNYVDATNLTPHERHSWIKLAKDYGYEVQAVLFDVPLEVCLERNQKRQRVVAEDVMRRMSAKLRAPTFDEGFSKITVVRVKQK
jgi:predicted kinase